MKGLAFGNYVACVSIAAMLLVGCGGAASAPGFAAPADADASWVLPEAGHEALIYVSLVGNGGVGIFSFTGQQVGRLKGPRPGFNGLEAGLCSDRSGNVFVTDPSTTEIVEYAHGGTKPIEVLSDPNSPVGCSVDPQTGNLAAVSPGGWQRPGTIDIFKNSSGTPTVYSMPNSAHSYHCAYDDKSDLFITGEERLAGPLQFVYAELPAGRQTIQIVPLHVTIRNATELQWDGKFITISDGLHRLYRTVGDKVVGVTAIGSAWVGDFWIRDNQLVNASGIPYYLGLWKYPAGGPSIERYSLAYEPLGLTVSAVP